MIAPSRLTSILIHFLSFVLVIALLYLPSLSFSFVLDDHSGVEKNMQIRSIGRILERPQSIIRLLTSYLSYRLGGIDPAAFRIVNIVFHLGNVMLLYLLLRKWVSSPVAFVGGLLVAVHPLVIESVVWISSVTYPQYSFFLILSILLYLKYRDRRKISFLIASYGAFCMSFLISEKAFILPVLIVLYELVLGSIKRAYRSLLGYGGLVVALAWYVLGGLQSRVESFASSAVTGTVEWLNPVQQVPYVLGTYLRLMLWPDRLTVYQFDERGYDPSVVPLYCILLIGYILLLVFSYRKHRPSCFLFASFAVASLPALLPYHIIQIGAERYAYLGAGFFILGLVLFIDRMTRSLSRRKIMALLLIPLILCFLVIRSWFRLQDWESEMPLRQSVLRTAPYSARAYNNVGIQHMNEGRYDDALEYYKESIRRNPSYSHPYHNIGHMLALAKRYQEALRFYQKAYKINPHEWKTRQDMGQVLFILGRHREAVPHLEYAIQKGSPDAETLRKILVRIAAYEK